MKSVALASGFFIVGLIVGSLSFGNHTSTVVQASAVQASAPQESPKPKTFVVGPDGATLTPLDMKGVEPVVSPIATTYSFGFTYTGTVPLDGFACNACTLRDVDLTYAGGMYSLDHATVSVKSVTLKGAALNTFTFLQLVNALSVPKAAPGNPNRPALNTSKLTVPTKVLWVSKESSN
jgi:hypothetical protein